MGNQISRNDGINASKGKYIAFLDDDDFWVKEKCIKKIKSFHDNIGMLFSKGYIYNKGKITDYYNVKCFK